MKQTLKKVDAWLRNTDLIVLLVSLAVIVGILVFVQIAGRVRAGGAPRFDTWLLESLRRADEPRVPIGPKAVPEAARDLTALGGVTVVVLMILAVTVYLLICRLYGAVCFLLAAILGGVLLSTVLKNFFDRPRPDVVPHLDAVHSASFPSGHSMLAAVVYLTLGALLARMVSDRRRKLFFIALAMLLTFLVGCSRVVLGVHYPTDVLGGWSAGLAWAALCWLAARYLQRRGVVEKTEV